MTRQLLFLCLIISWAGCTETENTSDAYGNFEATVSTISAQGNGPLLWFEVEEGQRLDAGQVVGIVDTTQLHLQKEQLWATIRALPKKLRDALADIQVLEKQKANVRRERDRLQRLIAKKAAPAKQLDDLNGELEVLDQKIAAIRAQTSLANRAILAEKEPLRAQIAVLEDQIRRARIVNPVAGTVLTKLVEPYEVVRTGTPLYRIGQLDTLTLRFYVSGEQLADLRLGQEIEVLTDAGANDFRHWTGTISHIADEAEFTPKTIQTKEDRVYLVYAVQAHVANPEGVLKIGMPAEVRLHPPTNSNPQKPADQ